MTQAKMALLTWIYELYRLVQQGETPAIYDDILNHVTGELRADCGLFVLRDADGVFRVAATRECCRHQRGDVIAVAPEALATCFTRENPPLAGAGFGECPRCIQAGAVASPAAFCWPLRGEDGPIGMVCGYRKAETEPYTEDESAYGRVLLELMNVVFESARLRRGQEERIASLSDMNRRIQEVNHKLEQASHQLLQSEKMASIGQLAAGVAHEINNPIGYVYSNLGSLEKYLQDFFAVLDAYERLESLLGDKAAVLVEVHELKAKVDFAYLKEDVLSLLAESREGINRVKKIVQDLKDFSHVGAEDEWQWADLHKGLDSTLNIVWNELKYKSEVKKEYGELPRVYCLPSQLNQVFMNILVNAAHAIETKGVITLRTGAEGDKVWVEVEDTGKGIAPEHLTRIFDPFFTTKPVGKGTGLGLSVSYSIVEKHHGKIEVKSEVGKGTVFRVWLPVRQEGMDERDVAH